MVHSVRRVVGRSVLAGVVCLTLLVGVGVRPAAADVTSVSGSAFGFYVNVGLFGGARTLRGAGSGVGPSDESYSPAVTLPAGGSAAPVTASDPDGAKAVYGPAVIFGGQWPDSAASGPSSGPMSVSTQGVPGGLTGSVTSSAEVRLHDTPQPVGCYTGFSPPCLAPGGFGPGPLIGDRAQSTCTADASGVSGSSTFVNGKVETKYDKSSQLSLPDFVVPIPDNPPPNWTVSGTIDHVGDRFTIVINEQIIGPDSITVNAAHMYLLGDVARGDMVVGSSTCSLTNTVANAAPVAGDEAFTTAEDAPRTVAAPGLLANDSDPDGHPLTATNAQSVFVPGPSEPGSSAGTIWTFPSDPPNGAVTINGNGSFTYTPDKDFFGTDAFDYVARDPRGRFDTGRVTMTVTPVQDNPVAVDDVDQVVQNTPVTVAAPGVLVNDTDGDANPLTASSASDPPHGTVSLAANGSFTYTPDPGFLGTDTFTYVVNDGTGRSDTGMVTILVTVDGATLLKDINPGSANSSPSTPVPLGGAVYFAANSAGSGTELWKSDGTPGGTVLLKDINVGAGNGNPAFLTEFAGALYFAASNGTANGTELWKTDGTPGGTVMVKDINPGAGSSSPGGTTAVTTSFKVVGSTLYFSANNGAVGTELWKSDGTNAGTVLVKDINVSATAPTTTSSSPGNFGAVGTTLYFSATNSPTTSPASGNGVELWKSDGTTANTVMVKDINVSATGASSSPSSLVTMGSTLYFRATNGAVAPQNGIELWKSDGTAAGTVMVKDINVGIANSNPSGLFVYGNMLLFGANDGDTNFATELWRSDGTTAGTVMVANLNAVGHSSPSQFKQFGNIVLFSANGGNGTDDFELWRTDGTEAGTRLVKDLNPAGSSFPSQLTVVGNTVYFAASNGAKGTELFRTNGTAAGTRMAEDLNPGAAASLPGGLTAALGTAFFAATDATNGRELWRLASPLVDDPRGAVVADFDGNGTTDRGVYRNGAWLVQDQPAVYFGLAGDVPVPGDYDGDGSTDQAIYRGGAWFIEGQPTVYMGAPDDVPVPGDYDGDGTTDQAVYRNGAWFIEGQPTVYMGAAGDVPVPGDYDGDGSTDQAVFRNGAWFIEGQPTVYFGLAGDVPVPGDYDGDGTTDQAIYRNGAWFIEGQSTVYMGAAGDVPVPGDYDGDGTTDQAVYRNGAWFVEGLPTAYYGLSSDTPLPIPYAIYRTLD